MNHEAINLLLAQIKQAHFAASQLCDVEFVITHELRGLTLNSLRYSLAEIGAGVHQIPSEIKEKFPKVKWEFFESMHKNAALDSDLKNSASEKLLTKWIVAELSPALDSLRKYLLSALLD